MSIQELVEKVKGEWEGIFIEQEDDIRNIFLSNLDASKSMGISLELITIEETNYLAGKLNLICEGEDEKPIGWSDLGINENMFEGMSPYAENPNYINLLTNVYNDRIKPIIETENMLVPKRKPMNQQMDYLQ